MTHEEAFVHVARAEARSYSDYPFMIYQIQSKFRDEPRARGGLMRTREFTMKDAYSFHRTQEDLERYYDIVHKAYERIFARAGIPETVSVRSDSGMMGGKVAHEFMLLADCGEDSIVVCPACGYKANMEAAVAKLAKDPQPEQETALVETPGVTDIESLAAFFKVGENRLCKAAVFAMQGTDKIAVVFLRGDLQVNEAKLRVAVGADVFPLVNTQGIDLEFGYIGPVELQANNAVVLFDQSLEGETNLIAGANKAGYHLQGVSVPRDVKPAAFVDVAKVNEGDACQACGAPLTIRKGVEVGNIFQLGTRYTKAMNMTYTDENSQQQTPIMGCYGIGVGRFVASVVEARHDAYGPIWPYSIAPWQVHICMLNSSLENVRETGNRLYEQLSRKYEVMLDDRPAAAGAQFADADLLGIPVRLVVSSRNLDKGVVEIATRDKSIKTSAPVDQVEQAVAEIVAKLEADLQV
jgi:prolyl-tRNA synthetase